MNISFLMAWLRKVSFLQCTPKYANVCVFKPQKVAGNSDDYKPYYTSACSNMLNTHVTL